MMRMAIKALPLIVACLLAGCESVVPGKTPSEGASLTLSANGKTDYVIVKPEKPTVVDDYAVKELAGFMLQKTGAKFDVVVPGSLPPGKNRIFVGLSGPALEILGKSPLGSLRDQEYVCRSMGCDIFLYGKGVHGNFHAVLDFMENTLGRRWYSKFDKPVFSVERDLVVKPFERKRGFDFVYRQMPHPSVFSYQQGLNMDFTECRTNTRNAPWFKEFLASDGKKAWQWLDENMPSGMVSARPQVGGHALFCYIPPHPGQVKGAGDPFAWMANNNYFKTNPDFFSMNKNGQRVSSHQLCFSNPELRKELTKNILEHIKRLGVENVIVLPGQNDSCGAFCECPNCKKLEELYASPGGPMYDYLFELCSTLATQRPDVMVKMFAYYSGMTRKPPTLPAGKTFPKNLIVWFCTVEEALNVDWNHPLNTSRSLYDDLLNWRKLTPHLWTWCYPNQYGNVGAGYLPSGVVERLVTDIRLMKQAGCEGVYYEFDSPSVAGGNGFTELQIYLYCKLTQDVNSDVPALITEFTDYQYGAAAPLVRKYRDELEAAQRALKVPMTMWPSVLDFYGQHAYLSLENILRWQGYFDRMEKDVAADARRLANVRRLRRALEFATLARWNELANKHPGIFTDYRVHEGRLGKMSAGEKAVVDDFETFIKIGGKAKPLPPPFDGMAPARVQRFIPINGRGNKHVIEDDAAFGYAATVDLPDFPFNFGFYQQDTKKAGPQRTLKAGDIKPNTYQLHKLGEIEVTPSCLVWFSAKSWGTSLDVGNRLYEAGADNAHDVYVSLKFSGPSYGGKEKEDQVLCDQIIFVKKPAKQ